MSNVAPTAKQVRQFADGPMAFFASIHVRGASGVVRFGDVMAKHQRDWLETLAPSLLALSRGEQLPASRVWIEGTKGSGKDFCLSLAVLWLLAFSKRPGIFAQVAAANQEQADELRKSAKSVLRYNRWLSLRVLIHNYRLSCRQTECEAVILACGSDGAAHGARPDLLILNEVCHIGAWEFAETLMDNAAKVRGLAIVATNAGFTGTDAFRWREMARTSSRWKFLQFAAPPPWMDPAEVEEAKLRNSLQRFSRLFFGEWSRGAGDALDPEDIAAAVTLKGPFIGRDIDYHGWSFVGGLDLGIKHDHSALVVLGVQHGSQRIRLAWAQSWRPPVGGKVDLTQVEQHVLEQHRRFHFQRLAYDPHQAELMSTRLKRKGMVCEEVAFVGQNLDRMATTLMEVFRSHVIDLYDSTAHGKQLIRDLGRLTIEEKAYGQRLSAVADADGHADTATALAIALPFARRLMSQSRSVKAEDVGGFRAMDNDKREQRGLPTGRFMSSRDPASPSCIRPPRDDDRNRQPFRLKYL